MDATELLITIAALVFTILMAVGAGLWRLSGFVTAFKNLARDFYREREDNKDAHAELHDRIDETNAEYVSHVKETNRTIGELAGEMKRLNGGSKE